eukprot:CAMPEP_0198289726 /NCGR_PEP_ID=MMETSP1449-20131203/7816_1 /TAXON_ID=420275 /ORGANISM="Attheya septentrionalis, Strain CCMP2084" /LENGTH=885 /DNA_ID=CAMNT_0043988103 /DNA_START=300 /DNA_END=2954 /DNA_ORIENTATION=-
MDFDNDISLGAAMGEGALRQPYASVGDSACNMFDWHIDNLAMETSYGQTLEEEMTRLQVLKSYLILDAPPEDTFERMTGLASRMFDVPISLVSLIDLGRQWFMSNRGLGDTRETPRDQAFCAHAILSTQDLLIVNDAVKDSRFMFNPLVTSAPHIRFYAGAPLICPEGYKLGTLCIIDQKPHPNGLSLSEKQNLRELAALVVDSMVNRKREMERASGDKAHLIACTAHDLLTPLTGIKLNLSLLMEDKHVLEVLDQEQTDLVQTALSCSDIMSRICHEAIDTGRRDAMGDSVHQPTHRTLNNCNDLGNSMQKLTEEVEYDKAEIINIEDERGDFTGKVSSQGEDIVIMSKLVENLREVIEPYPKQVPLSMYVDENVPPAIVSDDLKLFRSALNYLTNACKNTESGSVNLHIYVSRRDSNKNGDLSKPDQTRLEVQRDMLVFECEDTGPGIDVKMYPSLFLPFSTKDNDTVSGSSDIYHVDMSDFGLGLFSIATNIGNLGGEFGFRPREEGIAARKQSISSDNMENDMSTTAGTANGAITGSVFWFSVPLILPAFSRCSVEDALVESATGMALSNKKDTRKMITDKEEYILSKGSKRTLETHSTSPSSFNESVQAPVNMIGMGVSGTTGDETSATGFKKTRVKRALVIDDSLTIRKGIDRALTLAGCDVTQACDGMEGLRELRSTLFDIVFCDFLMPVMDGLDCVQQYREWESNHRPWFRQYIIGISAHATKNDAERGLNVGMDSFCSKPIAPKSLREELITSKALEVSKQVDAHFVISQAEEKKDILAFDSMVKETNRKAEEGSLSSYSQLDNPSCPVCLIATGSTSVGKTLMRAVEALGWRGSLVQNGEDALRLLKMRNWDAVFLDDEMPMLAGMRCISCFREW